MTMVNGSGRGLRGFLKNKKNEMSLSLVDKVNLYLSIDFVLVGAKFPSFLDPLFLTIVVDGMETSTYARHRVNKSQYIAQQDLLDGEYH